MDTAQYNRQRVIHLAKKHADNRECPRCHAKKKDWRVVPIYEFGDPEMPSQVVLYCNACKQYNEVFAQAPDAQARAYAEEVMREKKGGFRTGTQADLDKLIKLK